MSIENGLAFAVAISVLLGLPGRANLLASAYRLGRGWLAAVTFVVGIVIGGLVMIGAALGSVMLLMRDVPSVFEFIQLIAGAGMLLVAILVWHTARRKFSVAANDNLPNRTLASIFAEALRIGALNLRFYIFSVLLLSEISATTPPNITESAVYMMIFAGICSVATGLRVILAEPVAARARSFNRRKSGDRSHTILRVSPRTVTVGYRRIAA